MKTIYLRSQWVHDTPATKKLVFNFVVLRHGACFNEIKTVKLELVEYWKNFSSEAEALNYLKNL